jgi:hypothetical protein
VSTSSPLLALGLCVAACGQPEGAKLPASAPASAKPAASSPPSASANDKPAPSTSSTAAPREAGGDAVLEAVFRHQLKSVPASTKEGICLRVRTGANDLGDASDGLLAAIRKSWPTARKASECKGGGPSGPIVVSATGEPAMMLDIGPVEWDGETAARVKGGASHGGPHASEIEYRLERDESGAWSVKSEKTIITT